MTSSSRSSIDVVVTASASPQADAFAGAAGIDQSAFGNTVDIQAVNDGAIRVSAEASASTNISAGATAEAVGISQQGFSSLKLAEDADSTGAVNLFASNGSEGTILVAA